MDWSNERYVRLYVRDTMTWLRLGFEGQSVFCLLLRKLDRAGVLELDSSSPEEAAVAHLNGPVDFIATGIKRVLALRVLEHVGDNLVCPNFIEAQESSKSEPFRQKESRMKRRDQARLGLGSDQKSTVIYFVQSENGGEIKIGRADDVAKRVVNLQTGRPDKLVILAAAPGTASQERELHERFSEHRIKGEWFSPAPELMKLISDVTRHKTFDVTSRDTSHVVTCHETSGVTLTSAVQCSAVQNSAEESVREPLQKQRKPEDGLAAHVQSTFTRTHFAKHGSNPPKSSKAAKSVAVWCRANAIPMGRTPEALADTVVVNYFATQDRRVVEAMHPFAWLANGPQRYAGKSVTLLTARPVDDGDELQAEWERKRAAIAAEKQLKLGDA